MNNLEINEDLRRITLTEMKESGGVLNKHLLSLSRILFLKEKECQIVLKISQLSWNSVIKTEGLIEDPSLAILVMFYIENPDEWPVEKKTYDFKYLSKKLKIKESQLPMYTGRSNFALYRWKQYGPPSNHTSSILDIVDKKTATKVTIEKLKSCVKSIAISKGVDVDYDISWSGKRK